MHNIKKLTTVIAFLLILFFAGACNPQASQQGAEGTQTGSGGNGSSTTAGSGNGDSVSLTTSDGHTIAGNFVKARGSEQTPAVLLVHQLGLDKGSYAELQAKLAAAGISSLAIDMRGHGGSTDGGALDYNAFTDAEWEAVVNDFKSGLDYLRNQPTINPRLLGIVGASISANLAVVFAAEEISGGLPNPPKALVLLSPGINYHGIMPLRSARDLERIPVYIVSAKDDTGSYKGAQGLSQAARGGELHEYEGSEHGTDLFTAHPELVDRIVAWLQARVTAVPATAPTETQPSSEGTETPSGSTAPPPSEDTGN